jgi:hypothetical protein
MVIINLWFNNSG